MARVLPGSQRHPAVCEAEPAPWHLVGARELVATHAGRYAVIHGAWNAPSLPSDAQSRDRGDENRYTLPYLTVILN